MVNIDFITRKWAPAVGGMETYSLRLTAALRSFASVTVFSLSGQDNGLPPRPFSLFVFGFRTSIQIFFRLHSPPVLHLGDMAIWPLGIVARLRSRSTRIVLSAHGTDVAYHRRGGLKGRAYGLYLRLGARLLRNAKIVANSEATRKVTAETGWTDIDVVPLATDIAGLEPTGECARHILFAGRLIERKGCAWFVQNVLPLLPADIRLKVAGTGWDEAEDAALNDPRVDFLGSLHGDALVDAYRQALCVIVPNIEPKSGEYEGFGLVATEAAAAGTIVIAARTGGLVQAVENGVTGYLVLPGDAQAWRHIIDDISAWNADKRKEYLVRSMAYCQQYYCWDRVARETYRAYGLYIPADGT